LVESQDDAENRTFVYRNRNTICETSHIKLVSALTVAENEVL